MEQHRPMGSGERRVGCVLALESDIFGFAYCILLRDRYILENLDILRGQYWQEENSAERDQILQLFEENHAQVTSIQDEGESVEFFSSPTIE
jgi:hypothetical protein